MISFNDCSYSTVSCSYCVCAEDILPLWTPLFGKPGKLLLAGWQHCCWHHSPRCRVWERTCFCLSESRKYPEHTVKSPTRISRVGQAGGGESLGTAASSSPGCCCCRSSLVHPKWCGRPRKQQRSQMGCFTRADSAIDLEHISMQIQRPCKIHLPIAVLPSTFVEVSERLTDLWHSTSTMFILKILFILFYTKSKNIRFVFFSFSDLYRPMSFAGKARYLPVLGKGKSTCKTIFVRSIYSRWKTPPGRWSIHFSVFKYWGPQHCFSSAGTGLHYLMLVIDAIPK